MSSIKESSLGLNYGWSYGETGWNSGMDENIVLTGFHANKQIKGILSTPPTTGVNNGDAYIVGSSPTGAWVDNYAKVAIYDRGSWLFATPSTGVSVYNRANGCWYEYNNGWSLRPEAEESPYIKVKDFDFSTGYTITDSRQLLFYPTNQTYYQWNGALPKVVTAGSTPATSGGISPTAWVDRTDLTLRNGLGFKTETLTSISLNGEKTQFESVIVESEEFDKPMIRYYPNEDSLGLSTQSVNQVLVNDVNSVTYPPNPQDYTGLNKHYFNNVFSIGSNAFGANDVRRTTIFGSFNCQTPISWNFVDAYGMNSMSFAQYASRTTAIGTETFVWAGASSKQHLIDYMHDFWRQTSENQHVPGDASWDYDGLETLHPGIGARIDSFTNYATAESDFQYNTAVGRDSGNHIVKGNGNTFNGYQCAAHLFYGSYNTLYGLGAGRNGVFNDYITGFGYHALRDSIDSPNATALGYGAGRTVVAAPYSTMVGDRTADGVLSAERAVLIGSQAGRNHSTDLDDKLIINNQDDATRNPLISGNFNSSFVGHNIQPENIRAFNHFRIAASGSSLVPASAHGLLIEGNSLSGLTIESSDTGYGRIQFADTSALGRGAIEYSHSSDSLNFTSGGATVWRLTSGGNFRPITDNSVSVGEASYRPSVIYAATATISTSDEDYKTFCDVELSDILLDVWAGINWRAFKFNESIQEKGADAARVHFGLGAQTVKKAFEDAGLDAFKYGLLCYDEWEATDAEIIDISIGNVVFGDTIIKENVDSVSADKIIKLVEVNSNRTCSFIETSVEQIEISPAKLAGSRYGVRYEEALALEAALMRRTTNRLEARIAELESK